MTFSFTARIWNHFFRYSGSFKKGEHGSITTEFKKIKFHITKEKSRLDMKKSLEIVIFAGFVALFIASMIVMVN